MIIIGLTGGIGSGKTTVSDYLISKNFEVIDADKIAREILHGKYLKTAGDEVITEKSALNEVIEAFGEEMLLKNGTLDRKKLGSLVFADFEKKLILEQIVHKKIFAKIEEDLSFIKKSHSQIVFLDAPLLFETKLNRLTDINWLIDTDDETRIKRVVERDRLPREEIVKRMQNQMSRDEKLKLADVVINNSGNVVSLHETVDKLIVNILQNSLTNHI